MQAWHLPVGPSELHLVGAMPVYLLFGFIPTLFGFGLGLLVQALVFEPQDMAHLAVNFLSLAVPLVTVHHTLGKRCRASTWPMCSKLDAVYYAGVTLMVGFWLSISNDAAPVADWALFAASYTSLVAMEPLLTIGLVALAGRLRGSRVGQRLLAACIDEACCAAQLLRGVCPSAQGLIPLTAGKIMLVGIGPSSTEHMTARARAAIAEPTPSSATSPTSSWWLTSSRAKRSSTSP